MDISHFLAIAATHIATTYGYGELSCTSPIHSGVAPCVLGTFTASGEMFDPKLATAAIHLPKRYRIRPQIIRIKTPDSPCTSIRLNDKKGNQGFDLSPGALSKMGIKPHSKWSDIIELC